MSCDIDVTEQRVAERTAELARLTDSLRGANEQLQAIFDAASSGILLVRDDTIERCNRRLTEMTGFSAAELIGSNCRLIVTNPLAWDDSDQATPGRMARGESWSSERHIRPTPSSRATPPPRAAMAATGWAWR